MCYEPIHGRTTCQPVLTTSLQPLHIPTRGYNITQSSAPDDGHMVARNMLSNYQKRNKEYKMWHLVSRQCVHGLTTCQPHLTTLLQPRHIPAQGYNITQSSAPHDGHMFARNMLSNYQKRNKEYKSDIQLVFLIHTKNIQLWQLYFSTLLLTVILFLTNPNLLQSMTEPFTACRTFHIGPRENCFPKVT